MAHDSRKQHVMHTGMVSTMNVYVQHPRLVHTHSHTRMPFCGFMMCMSILQEDSGQQGGTSGWSMDERTKKAIVELQRHWLSEYHSAREKVLVELAEKVRLYTCVSTLIYPCACCSCTANT
jgi:hypothetical protein